ncbi:MAG: Tyrosine-protein kinase MasK [Phycisphaerae bacterium]|nr:Tyrosine-protein kinase MasK [Phycisphaerae bacterium]
MGKNVIPSARKFSGYIVQRRLGSGASSAIFEVSNPTSGDTYALKRVIKRTESDERFLRQTENEYEIGHQVDHPNVRRMFQIFRLRSFFRVRELHLLMELVPGKTLEQHRPTRPLTIARIFIQIASGLDAMHQAGFVHADIKPNNVIVMPDGQVKIIDLGQSCPMGTIKQRIQGTPDYIAPEQVYRHPIDRRTDIFNIGATLYWLLTERHVPTVLPKRDPGREIALVTSSRAEPPHEINPRIPASLSRLAMDCVKVSPTDRPSDMRVLLDRLETIELMLSRTDDGHPDSPGDWADGQVEGNADNDTVDLPGLEAV